MANSINVQRIDEFRFTYFDEGEVRKDKILTAKIVEIHWGIGKGSTTNGLEYWQATVEAELPNGSQRGPALLWDKLLCGDENLEMEDDLVSEGSEIILAIICNGEDLGNAIIEIPDFHIKYKELHDNGFTGIELFEEESSVDSEKDIIRETEDVDPAVLINGRAYENSIYEEENNYEIISEELESTSNNTKQKEEGIGKIILIFIISFIFIGVILGPLSFLGFILYPVWIVGTLLLSKFIYNIFTSAGSEK